MAVVEAYIFNSGNIPVNVSIESDPNEFVLVYKISISHISANTEIILEKIRNELVDKVKLGISDITDPKKLDFIKGRFQKTIINLIRKYLPDLDQETLEFFTTYLMHKSFGLGKVELLMSDTSLEEVVINNSDDPIWVYHHKHGWLKTNVILEREELIKHYATVIARRVGRSITLLNPLLDAHLDTGDRVNATLSPISTKGNTITIRKFSTKPITITNFIQNKAISVNAASLIWLGMEYELSTLVSGGTASGKCVSGDTKIVLGDGSVRPIKEIVENELSRGNMEISDGWMSKPANLELFSFDKNNKIKKSKVTHVWKRKANNLYKIKTRTGRKIIATGEHPFFKFDNGKIKEIRADQLTVKERVACARNIPINGKDMDLDIFSCSCKDKFYTNLTALFSSKEILILKKNNHLKAEYWNGKKNISLRTLQRIVKNSPFNLEEIISRIALVKTKTGSCMIKLPKKISPELSELLGYIIGDGHIHKSGLHVSFTNLNKSLRERVNYLFKKIFNVISKEKLQKHRTEEIIVHSLIIADFLTSMFGIPKGKKDNIVNVPEKIFLSTQDSVRSFLRGLFDSEAYVKNEIEFSSSSEGLAEGVRTLLLREGIVSYVKRRTVKGFSSSRLFIYGDNIIKYKKLIGFNHPDKKANLEKFAFKGHSNYDIVPNLKDYLNELFNELSITKKELSAKMGVTPRALRWYLAGGRNPSLTVLGNIMAAFPETIFSKNISKVLDSDLFWDEVVEVEKLDAEEWVYDLSVDEKNFVVDNGLIAHNTSFLGALCSFFPPNQRIISIEDTREIQLPKYLHWIPMVTRESNVEGKGGIEMLDLIVNSLRMRPDRLVIGEIRRKQEAETLFEAMHTGHSVYATLHANDAQETVTRLVNPPIDIPKTLLPAVSMIVTMYRNRRTGIRRIFQIAEITKDAEPNVLLQFDLQRDKMLTANSSVKLMPDLQMQTGLTQQEVNKSLTEKGLVLKWLTKNNIDSVDDIGKVVATYYTNKNALLNFIQKNA